MESQLLRIYIEHPSEINEVMEIAPFLNPSRNKRAFDTSRDSLPHQKLSKCHGFPDLNSTEHGSFREIAMSAAIEHMSAAFSVLFADASSVCCVDAVGFACLVPNRHK